MCPFMSGKGSISSEILCYGIQVFLLIWIIFVPIAITNRLERIIKQLEKLEKTD